MVNAKFNQLYDQAGIMLGTSERNGIKVGVEVSDGQLQLASVVPHDQSD
ncbi:hypothetical protein StoSoilB3_42060 (plasmid) [Arthrobacter sp. StoSoilB3]|nr:hypothetical protein StoSoilB3_42060 [Arthrobacter sp. StoSoilB3]